MELTLSTCDGFTVAATHGNLDETAREAFRDKLHPLVGEKGTRLIVDLAGSQRVNSPGIGNMVALNADANTNDSRVVFCNLQPYVSMVVSVTKLDRFFNIVADLDAAVAWCKQE
jgi:anti-sigma B factor antagonist